MKIFTPLKNLARVFLIVLSGFFMSWNFDSNNKYLYADADFRFLEADITQIQQGYKDGSFTIREVTQAYLDRIQLLDRSGPSLNSIIQVNPDAIQIAEALDKEMEMGIIRGPLHGIPIILKDNINTHDKLATTAGSRALRNSFPPDESYIAKRLKDGGALILGKANLSEWANFRGELSPSGWSGLGGLTKNPYLLDRSPGGSSSGSAVAVSANLTMLAIGTETNGSIITPSNHNGIVGIKPTVGLISRSGIIPISYTQDTPGPMARTVRDAAICMGTLTGIDTTDEKTMASEGKYFDDYTQFLNEDGLKGKRIGVPRGPFGIHYKVDELMIKAMNLIVNQGAEIIIIGEIEVQNNRDYSMQIMLYEFKDGLTKYFNSLGPAAPVRSIDDLIKFNETDSVELKYFNQKYLEMALEKGDLSSSEYQKALANMLKLSRELGIDRIMNAHNLDAIIAPSGGPAWKTDLINGDSHKVGSAAIAARAGYPNITVPMGFIGELPVGISFFGSAWSEPVLIEMAYAYETASKHRKRPKFLTED
jgi:amidase